MKSSILLFLVALCLLSCKNDGLVYENEFEFSGEIQNLDEEIMVYLSEMTANGTKLVDSVLTLKDYTFKLHAENESLYQITALGKSIFFVNDNPKIQFSSSKEEFDYYKVTGSDISEKFKNFTDSYKKILSDYELAKGILRQKLSKIDPNKHKDIYSIPEVKELENRVDVKYIELKEFARKNFEESQNQNLKFAFLFSLNPDEDYHDYINYANEELKGKDKKNDQEVDLMLRVKVMKEVQMKRIRVAEQLNVINLKGENEDILVGDDKPVFIHVWSSWCKHSRLENEELAKLYAIDGLDVIHLSVDKSQENWRKAVEEDGLMENSYRLKDDLNSKFLKEMFLTYLPFNILIDKDRNFITKNIRRDFVTEIEGLISE